jgi:hypothetical protein
VEALKRNGASVGHAHLQVKENFVPFIRSGLIAFPLGSQSRNVKNAIGELTFSDPPTQADLQALNVA